MQYTITDIRTIATNDSGSLSFFEAERDIPFEIKRVYYITNVPENADRGAHAHKALKQLLFCPYGEIMITLSDGVSSEKILLNNPSRGILIMEPLWRDMHWNIANSVLCVAASDYYNPDDYIRDYGAFTEYLKKRANEEI